MMFICKVLTQAFPQALDYLPCAQSCAEDFPFGTWVEVPYRNQHVKAIVIEVSDRTKVCVSKLKAIQRILAPSLYKQDDKHFFDAIALYYATQVPALLSMCLPRDLWREVTLDHQGFYELAEAVAMRPKSSLTASAWRLVDHLQTSGASSARGLSTAGFKKRTIQQCIDKHVLVPIERAEKKRVEFYPIDLSQEQKDVFDAIVSCPVSNKAHYVQGVTGSGKTYLYLALIQHHLSQGQQALLLVPEIALTPQLINKIKDYCPLEHVAMLHSGLSDAQRVQAWYAAQSAEVKLIVGTRSALFVPFKHLGLIIVDEEHDSSYKQMSQVRYSARGGAFLRARSCGARLVLGSATPSLSCLAQINTNRLMHHRLSSRFQGVALPRVSLIDIAGQTLKVGLSPQSIDLIDETLQRQQSALVFINRRGFSPSVWCPGCDRAKQCSGCDRPYTYHQSAQTLACHRCQVTKPMSNICDECHHQTCIPVGEGTEKVAAFLTETFPSVPVVKMDRDTCSTWRQMEKILEMVHASAPKVIVATQMMVKGHHVKDLQTVIVLGADQSLYSKDYRAQEYLLSQMVQVIGRAGRHCGQGRVAIQTAHTANKLWSFVIKDDLDGAAQDLLSQRRQYSLPPFCQQSAIAMSAVSRDALQKHIEDLSTRIKRAFPSATLYGPMPSILAKLKGNHRMVLLVQTQSKHEMTDILHDVSHILKSLPSSLHAVIDRDPLEI